MHFFTIIISLCYCEGYCGRSKFTVSESICLKNYSLYFFWNKSYHLSTVVPGQKPHTFCPPLIPPFPLTTSGSHQRAMTGRTFVPLLKSTGCSLIVRNEVDEVGDLNKMVAGIMAVWPLLVISYAMATMAGTLVWLLVSITELFQ